MILLKVNETLGERFREFTSHSAWSLLKATWISMPKSKASCSSTQSSDHPQLSHTFRPPRRVEACLVDPEFPTSLLLIFPDPMETTLGREPVLAGNVAWRGRRGESNSYCTSVNSSILQALQGSERKSVDHGEPVVNVIATNIFPGIWWRAPLMETVTRQHTGNPEISNASLKFKTWSPPSRFPIRLPMTTTHFSFMVLWMKDGNSL